MPSEDQLARQRLAGARIKKQRLALRLTQKDIAAQVGIDQSMVSIYEKGDKMPKAEHRRALERALHLHQGELLRWLEPEATGHLEAQVTRVLRHLNLPEEPEATADELEQIVQEMEKDQLPPEGRAEK